MCGEFVGKTDEAVYLGLRLDAKLQWSSHINYVVSRIKRVRVIFSRLAYLFNRSVRICICRSLVFPIISVYDFIYGVASMKYLSHLDTAYNDLMRAILGLRRSQHVRIAEMYNLTSFEPLAARRRTSLLKFMNDVKSERLYSKIRSFRETLSCLFNMHVIAMLFQ